MKRWILIGFWVLSFFPRVGEVFGAKAPEGSPGPVTAEARSGSPLTLEEAVRTALEKNSDIKMAESALRAARSRAGAASADLLAKFETRYSVIRLNDDPEVIFGKGLEFIAGSKPNYRFSVGFSQPLFAGFALTSLRELTVLGVDVARFQREETEEEIVFRTREAYFRLLLAGRLSQVSREAVVRLSAHQRDARALFDVGMIPRNDLLKSEVELAEAEQDRVRLENREELARSNLNLLLKRKVNAELSVADVLTLTPFPLSLEKSIEKGMSGRPAVLAVDTVYRQAEQSVRLARSGYYPKIQLVGEYYRQGDTLSVNGNGYTNTKNALIGVETEWTFFEWGKTREEVREALFKLERASEARSRIRDRVTLEIQKAYLDLSTAEKNVETARAALAQARENYRITDLQYREQMTTSTEVLDAQTLLTRAEARHYGALYGYNIARAALERAVGMGRP